MTSLDPQTRVLIRHIDSMGYAVNRMLFPGTGLVRLTAWQRDENPLGVYQRGQVWRAEGDDAYGAAVQLAAMLGTELEE